jgi:acetyl-CoA/propionyl-CoA carboxylase, biotin carboxylase, biotin carboxyl carrier protein
MLGSVLVANRGEIARRVIRTLRRRGIRSVAVYTDVDAAAPHVREADEAVRIAGYLDIEALVAAAAWTGAHAVHPGYGFLSENAGFARACADAGLTFVGPPPDAIELMGDKVRAKAAAESSGVPIVPSYEPESAQFPVMVKAAAGGGGRGMRIVERPEDLDQAIEAAKREALAGFGDDAVFIERFLPRARHIEVQVIADAHGTVRHLAERECSLQRRHQKVIEEAPSPVVDPELRERLGAEAVALARAAGYVNAGTVEFIADVDDPSEHYFLEMNTRLQVEHPVTELVTGLDIVELQLRVAAGDPLPEFELRIQGHAIEARVNAEDPAVGFLPSTGTVVGYREPAVPGIRVDSGIERRSRITTDHDSLLCKVTAHADDREAALARLDRALADTAILGVTTTTSFLRRLIATEEVRSGRIDTALIGRLELSPPAIDEPEVATAAALIQAAVTAERASDDPFEALAGFRIGGLPGWSHWLIAVDGGAPVEIRTRGGAGRPEYDVGHGPVQAEVSRIGKQAFSIAAGGGRVTWDYAYEGNVIWLGRAGHVWRTRRASSEEADEASVPGDLRAPTPGQVMLVRASAGDQVAAGDPVVVIESMKMELTIAAPVAGTITSIAVSEGDNVEVDQHLASIEPSETAEADEGRRLVALPAEDEVAWPSR